MGLLLTSLVALSSCSRPLVADSEPEASRRNSVLRLLYSRTPTTLNPHLASGFQDFEAARIVYEPLATYAADGSMVPVLAQVIPTPENGGIAADGRSITWRLKPDVRWSDGQPFTAEDVVFTYSFVSDPQVAAVTEKYYKAIEKVEAIDPLTVKITFKEPNPSWALPFTGQNGMILPKHIFEKVQGINARQAPENLQPVGTGPYRFITVTEGRWTYAANEQFREDLPAFTLVELEGGVTPYEAAQRVLREGSADFAHNLQIGVDDRLALAADSEGRVMATFGAFVERIMLNPTDPNKATEDGEKSSVENPHPFLSDVRVRQAIDFAIEQTAIADEIYGNAGQRTNQLLPFPRSYTNPNLPYRYDVTKANALLNEAGWKDTNGNGIRDKDGIEMRLVFQTPINPVRQQTQEFVKESLAAVEIEVENRQVTMDDFFSANPAQTRSLNHFYADMQKYNAGSDTPDPSIYMSWWLCDEVASLENRWQKPNNGRYCNPEYDKVWTQASKELDPEKRSQLFQQMNTILSQDAIVIPLVRRAVTNGVSDRITGVDPTPWDTSTWDIGTWMPAESSAMESETP
ncbi:peptide ABC transporter substrate-binding protein [cf. Phormidesmis sp. LEGE 11477]|uniref:peptide ABC transporter substrate-binding protein n=1 Tax=cf. Phormidesmis sp. LEGE 11477 TaxID=1828680 RepID=UPI00187F12A5|nr:peptide ABC transporter substrate-binding protein [cf. Phormidesmis sp. LEGE 11477]MBE9062010.1 peptide ABC transporter substrate-binding protein [cf. Phormidesmis sp. LEGE 11477]